LAWQVVDHGKERRQSSLQVFCYALSPPDGSEWRQRIEAEAEHFLDVSARSVGEIAAQISVRTPKDACHQADGACQTKPSRPFPC